jgi:hypothetical protein
MDGYLINKPDNFVDDPEKFYRLSRREAQQAKKLDFVDLKSEDEGSFESPKKSPPESPQENRLHRWENNRTNARSGSYAPWTSSTYQS